MSAEDKNKLDELFKNGLGEPDTYSEYNDQHWDDLEQLMDAGKKPRGIIYWLPRLGSVAAILLLFLGWWLFKPAKIEDNPMVGTKPTIQTAPAINKPDSNITNTVKGNGMATNTPNTPVTVIEGNGDKKPAATAPVYAHNAPKQTSARGNNNPANTGVTNTGQPVINNSVQQNVIAKVDVPVDNKTNVQTTTDNAATKIDADNSNNVIASTGTPDKPAQGDAVANNPTAIATKKATKVSAASGFKPQFGLAIMASPDVNGVGSFQNSKVGTNIGLLFSVGVTKKLTISTGAAYAKKPYLTDFADYYAGYKFKTDPQNVYADCRVLDIPLNVDYKFYSKSSNSFSIGSGLSSYLMLKEKYTYNYAVPGTYGPANYSVTNKNRHYFGVLNLNATYEHQLNTKFSVAAQPYLKVPLTDIGNGRVKLQSAGVALGVRWNINSKSITP